MARKAKKRPVGAPSLGLGHRLCLSLSAQQDAAIRKRMKKTGEGFGATLRSHLDKHPIR